MNPRPQRIVLAGGGTGGHVIPAIAVAEEIVRRGHRVCFVGTRDRIEASLVPAAGFDIHFIDVRPLVGKNIRQAALGIATVPIAVARSMRLLFALEADVVLGVGGYVAGPVMLAAKMMRIPLALLEQNATLGLTNKLLARFVDRAFVCYEETLEGFTPGRAELTGNPVKASILAAALDKKSSNGKAPVRIVVMGGSQGARTIDERVPAAMSLAALGGKVKVLHQCGQSRMVEVKAAYLDSKIDADVVQFIDDTASAYLGADLVVARSGATTVSEVTVMGLPAVFLPYPHHADRQQTRNARPMRLANAAVVLDEQETGVKELAEAIAGFVHDKKQRDAAARASSSLGRPDAARRVVEGLLKLGQRKR